MESIAKASILFSESCLVLNRNESATESFGFTESGEKILNASLVVSAGRTVLDLGIVSVCNLLFDLETESEKTFNFSVVSEIGFTGLMVESGLIIAFFVESGIDLIVESGDEINLSMESGIRVSFRLSRLSPSKYIFERSAGALILEK